MTKKNEIYVCEICGNMVEVIRSGGGTLVCCGQPMTLQNENVIDASFEKHVPVVTREGNRITVEVGSVPHPMEENHFIEWIELITPERTERKNLKPGDVPQAEFDLIGEDVADENIIARAFCNLHGLWKDQK